VHNHKGKSGILKKLCEQEQKNVFDGEGVCIPERYDESAKGENGKIE